MGELVVGCEDAMKMVMVEKKEEEKKMNKEVSSSMMKWERFLARISLRVLLVEADDSTRQIVGALLRKCSYKVASVSDGLKAWEVLKARPHNIDLILTEVELPSVSGYALLTLIMEHKSCRNIPVIMMSAHDSVSTVYKCMLRGAADFLVKPIRTNELKNLWQHVWRRQAMSRPRIGPRNESFEQQHLEVTAENDAIYDHSIGSRTISPKQDECMKKGSDAQSSCGKPDAEAESCYLAEVENYSLPKQLKSPVSDLKIQEHSNFAKSDQYLHSLDIAVAGDALVQNGRPEPQNPREIDSVIEACKNRNDLENFSSKAIDLIGSFREHPRPNSFVNDVANKLDSFPELDLSLRKFHSSTFEHKTIHVKQALSHSNASAFTRYVNKPLCSTNANSTSPSTPKVGTTNAGDNFSNNCPYSKSNTEKSFLPHNRKMISLSENITNEVENEIPMSPHRLLPSPPKRGIFTDVHAAPAEDGSIIPTPLLSPNPGSKFPQQSYFPQVNIDVANGRHYYRPLDESPKISSNQPINKQEQNLESLGDRTQLSPATDQSASSTLCNETAGSHNVYGCRTGAENVQDAVVPGSSKSENELNRQRSIQREVALTKFRLKRKERCFEKKVRYESRKKLAEQRPRVKGQFVRQVPADPPQPKSENCGSTHL